MVYVYRYINGISLNPREYALTSEGDIRSFKNAEEALAALNTPSIEELEEQGFYIESEKEFREWNNAK